MYSQFSAQSFCSAGPMPFTNTTTYRVTLTVGLGSPLLLAIGWRDGKKEKRERMNIGLDKQKNFSIKL